MLIVSLYNIVHVIQSCDENLIWTMFERIILTRIICGCFRLDQTFVLYPDSSRSREQCGHCVSQHTPRAQWRHPYLPHQVHPVSYCRRSTAVVSIWPLHCLWLNSALLHHFLSVAFLSGHSVQRLFGSVEELYPLHCLDSFRSDVVSDFKIELQVYCLVSVVHCSS